MIPVAAAGLVLLAAGSYAAWRVHRLHSRAEEILGDNVASIRAAEELELSVREVRYRLKRYLSTSDRRHLTEAMNLLPATERSVEEVAALGKTVRERQLIDRVQAGWRELHQGVRRLNEVAASHNSVETDLLANILADEVIPNKALAFLQKYIDVNEREVTRSSRRNRDTANQLMVGLLLLGGFGGLAGLVVGYTVSRRVARTIVQLSFPIRDVAGKLDQVVGPVAVTADPGFEELEAVLRKVSSRVSAIIDRLRESERETLRAEQLAAVGQLAAGMAHELRNPLTSMKAIIQLAGDSGDLTAQDLRVLEQETSRLEQSLRTFLDFARPPHPEKRRVKLDGVLEDTVDLTAQRARRQGIRLAYHPSEEDITLFADSAGVRQVVLNLLINAFDAVPRGGVVELTAWRESAPVAGDDSPPRPAAVVQVADDGCGLPAELRERVFDPFVSTKDTGTGLGLSICRRIVQAHGGSIDAADRPGGGTVFTVRLPLEAPEGAITDAHDRSPAAV